MKIGIMQPYIFPYIGYFQLINAVDVFVIYDNIQYTKKGWINRNRILCNGKDEYFSIPIQKDSDFLNVVERHLASDWNKEKLKITNKIKESYRKAPYFTSVFSLIEDCFSYESKNLFDFILNALNKVLSCLSIDTKIMVSSSIPIDHSLKSEQKVIAICKELKADIYINPIGGLELYNKSTFLNNDIKLQFIKTNSFQYQQFQNEFIPFLSILDVLMHNSIDEVRQYLKKEFIIL